MQSLTKLVAAVVCAVPLVAAAQTSTSPNVKAADQPRTQLEQEQTTKNGQATKYGGPGTDTGTAGGMAGDSTNGMTDKTKKKNHDMSKSGKTAPGDAPTYPAPAKDGTPTK